MQHTHTHLYSIAEGKNTGKLMVRIAEPEATGHKSSL
jgi:hypothetical protein